MSEAIFATKIDRDAPAKN